MALKIVLGTKDGKSFQKELSEEQVQQMIGMKIGDAVKGDMLDLEGYEFIITGGSDNSGTPMRRDVEGPGKRRILAVEGVGLRKTRHGMRKRKTVSGNTVSEQISQLNLKVTKEGKTPLGGAEEEKADNATKESN